MDSAGIDRSLLKIADALKFAISNGFKMSYFEIPSELGEICEAARRNVERTAARLLLADASRDSAAKDRAHDAISASKRVAEILPKIA